MFVNNTSGSDNFNNVRLNAEHFKQCLNTPPSYRREQSD